MIIKRIQGAKKIIEAHFWVFSEIFWYFLPCNLGITLPNHPNFLASNADH